MKSNRQKQRFCHPKMADLKAWSHGVRKANWDTGVNWDGNLVNRHLCDCLLKEPGVIWERNLVHRDP